MGIVMKSFYRSGGTRRPRGAEDVLLCLWGDAECLRSFTTRLRTEYVDVDRRGKKCKERKSKVLLEPTPAAMPPLASPPFEEREYGTSAERLAMLQRALGSTDAAAAEDRMKSAF